VKSPKICDGVKAGEKSRTKKNKTKTKTIVIWKTLSYSSVAYKLSVVAAKLPVIRVSFLLMSSK